MLILKCLALRIDGIVEAKFIFGLKRSTQGLDCRLLESTTFLFLNLLGESHRRN